MTKEQKELIEKTIDILNECIQEFRDSGYEDWPDAPNQAPLSNYQVGDMVETVNELRNIIS